MLCELETDKVSVEVPSPCGWRAVRDRRAPKAATVDASAKARRDQLGAKAQQPPQRRLLHLPLLLQACGVRSMSPRTRPLPNKMMAENGIDPAMLLHRHRPRWPHHERRRDESRRLRRHCRCCSPGTGRCKWHHVHRSLPTTHRAKSA